eukprot:8078940-Heterocapsa_arctica.AAC.1
MSAEVFWMRARCSRRCKGVESVLSKGPSGRGRGLHKVSLRSFNGMMRKANRTGQCVRNDDEWSMNILSAHGTSK